MKITIREVAAAAKVSLGTASRVLNGDPRVNPDHVKRVTDAAAKLNYRRLRVRNRATTEHPLQGKNIGLVMLGMSRSLVSLPVIAEMIHGAESALSQASATPVLIDVPDLDKPPPSLSTTKLDGILLKGALQGDAIARSSHSLIQRLFASPYLWLLGRPDGCAGDCVGSNDFRIGMLAAEHLIERGHKNVAFLNPKAEHVIFTNRQIAFESRFRRPGHSVVSAVGETAKWTLPLKPVDDAESVLDLLDRILASKRHLRQQRTLAHQHPSPQADHHRHPRHPDRQACRRTVDLAAGAPALAGDS
jgi:LacI family transcriptional regulator